MSVIDSSAQSLRGSVWMIAMRWSMKFISLINTIILVRLLMPEDFGLVAKAIVVVGLVEIIMDSGCRYSLVKLEDVAPQDYDTAFTMNALLGIAVFICLCILSPLLAGLMYAPELTLIIPLLACRSLLIGFSSPKTADFLRHFDYGQDFRFNVICRLITVPVTIVLAVIYQNYWALIGGQIIGQIAYCVMSYIMAPYQPRLTLASWQRLARFSFYYVGFNYATYLIQRMDEVILGRISTNTILGHYNIANEIGSLILFEIFYPLSRSLFPVFSRLQTDKSAFNAHFIQVFSIIWLILLPAIGGLCMVAPEIILLVGGEKWRAAIPLMQAVTMVAGFHVFALLLMTPLLASGGERKQSYLVWANMICLLLVLPVMGVWYGVQAMVLSKAVITVCFVPIYAWMVLRHLHLSFRDCWPYIWRPVLATIMMIAFLSIFLNDVHGLVWGLILKIIMGVIAYVVILLLLWIIVRMPIGSEATIMRWLYRHWMVRKKYLLRRGRQ